MLFSEPEHIQLDENGSELSYYPLWCEESQAQQYFEILLKEVAWQQDEISMYGKTHLLPRKTAWYGDKGVSYAYSGIRMTANGWNKTLFELSEKVAETAKLNFNSVLLNLYRDGQDSMGWHSDDEPELGANPVIASLSFGAARRFDFREKASKSLKQHKIELSSGSLLIMRGQTQNLWQHRIASTKSVQTPRINLTFRHIHSA